MDQPTDSGSRPGFAGSRENDLFAGVRGEGSEGSLMGPAAAAIACAVCCACIFVGLIIAFFVWAIVTLVDSAPSQGTECGSHFFVWQFCLLVVVIMPILGLCVNFIATATQAVGLAAIPSLISLGIAIWGFVIWAQLGECDHFYYQTYPDLLLLFKIYVIFFAICFAFLLCACACLVCFAGSLSLDAITKNSTDKPDGPTNATQDEELRNAVREGNFAQVESLLSGTNGPAANVNARDPLNGWTALHYAALHNQRRVAEHLVGSGARIDDETFDQKTALMIAQEQGNDVAAFLMGLGARNDNPNGASRAPPAATMEFV